MSTKPVKAEETTNLKHADRKFSYRGLDLNQLVTKGTDDLM